MHLFNRNKQFKKPLSVVMKRDKKVKCSVIVYVFILIALIVVTSILMFREPKIADEIQSILDYQANAKELAACSEWDENGNCILTENPFALFSDGTTIDTSLIDSSLIDASAFDGTNIPVDVDDSILDDLNITDFNITDSNLTDSLIGN